MAEFFKVTDEVKARIADVRRFAENPANWWGSVSRDEALEVGFSSHMFTYGNYKVIYTVEITSDGPVRNLSVSMWEGDDPNDLIEVPRFALFTFAQLFGMSVADGHSYIGPLPNSDPYVFHIIEKMKGHDAGEA